MFGLISKQQRFKARRTTKFFLFALLIVIVAGMLTACGDPATATSSPVGTGPTGTPGVSATPADPTPTNATQSPIATATPVKTSIPAATATSGSNQSGYNPVIRFSASSLKIGDSLTVSGGGYPVNSKISVLVTTTSIEASEIFGNTTTDGSGNFSAKITLNLSAEQVAASKGRVGIAVTTPNFAVSASAPVTVVIPAPAYSPVLKASATTVRIGTEVTLDGSGYPANLPLILGGGVQNTNETYGNVTTDGQGKFSKTVKLPESVTLGLYFIYATSSDFKYQAKVELNVLPATFQNAPELRVLGINPVIKIGSEFTLSGKGYPANTEIAINGGVQNPVVDFGTVKTDAQGNFTKLLKLGQGGLIAGPFFIYASTPDFKHQAHLNLTLTAAGVQ